MYQGRPVPWQFGRSRVCWCRIGATSLFSPSKHLAKNVSSTGILLFAIQFHVVGIGKVDLTSDNPQDYFFSEALQPGDTEMVDASLPPYGVSKATLAVKERTPTATASLKFVRFADGSVWGDPQSADEGFKVRQQSLDELVVLERSYANGGDPGISKRTLENQHASTHRLVKACL